MKFILALTCLLTSVVVFAPGQNADALSQNVVITQLQTNGYGTGTSGEEFVLITNISLLPIDITGWCLRYSASGTNVSATSSLLGCVPSHDALGAPMTVELLPGAQYSFATPEFIAAHPGFAADFIGLSPKMAKDDGHLALFSGSTEIDRVGWGEAKYPAPEGPAALSPVGGMILSQDLNNIRDTDNNSEDFPYHLLLGQTNPQLFVCEDDDGFYLAPDGYMVGIDGDCYKDVCPNLDDLQITLPVGYFLNSDADCELIPLEGRILFITELLPNAPSTDTGQEFIELYNPNDETINLAGYRLQLGPSFTKEYVFVSGEIKPGEYLTFSDIETSIVLPNDNGAVLRLIAPAGNTVSESAMYENAEDDTSWALVDDIWIFTNQITPGAANKPYVQPAVDEEVGVTSVLAPCPAGKYRNPETNRCRTIETAVASLTPCDEDEYRNPETNRCRKTATTSSTLTLCDEGEERNPETNRCRKVSVLGVSDENDLAAIGDVAVQSTPGQLNWPVILATLTATGGYMVYEWRNELRQKLMFARLRR